QGQARLAPTPGAPCASIDAAARGDVQRATAASYFARASAMLSEPFRRDWTTTREAADTAVRERSSSVARGPLIAAARTVRAIVLVTAVVIVAAWIMFHRLP